MKKEQTTEEMCRMVETLKPGDSLALTITIPDDADDATVIEATTGFLEALDAYHRACGGHGLKVETEA